MQDIQFSSPAKREAFRANIAKHQAKIRARLAQKVVPPVRVNGAVACDDPSAPGASVGHPLITSFHVIGPMAQIEHESPFDGSKPIGQSNLDLTGRHIVKRGDTVSWYGLRFTVSKVRMGMCYPVQPSAAGSFLPCRSVQVVG